MRKNVASQNVSAQLVATADGSAVTSGTTTVYVTGDGGTQGAGGGTVTHEGQGTWNYVPTQAETNFNQIAFTFTNASAVSVCVNVYTVAFDPTDTVRAGLTALPNVASGNSGAIPTVGTGTAQISLSSGAVIVQSGTGTGQISLSSGQVLVQSGTGTGQISISSGIVACNVTQISGDSGAADNAESFFDGTGYSGGTVKLEVNVLQWNDDAVATPNFSGVPIVDVGYIDGTAAALEDGTAQTGTTSTITLANTASSTDNIFQDALVEITSGTGAGSRGICSSYNGTTKVLTIFGTWTGGVTPDATSTYTITSMQKQSSRGLDNVVPADPNSTKPTFSGSATIVQWIGFFGALSVNEWDASSSSLHVRNTADNANLGTCTVSDDGTTVTVGAMS